MTVNYSDLTRQLSELIEKYENYKSGTVPEVLRDLLYILRDFAQAEAKGGAQ